MIAALFVQKGGARTAGREKLIAAHNSISQEEYDDV